MPRLSLELPNPLTDGPYDRTNPRHVDATRWGEGFLSELRVLQGHLDNYRRVMKDLEKSTATFLEQEGILFTSRVHEAQRSGNREVAKGLLESHQQHVDTVMKVIREKEEAQSEALQRAVVSWATRSKPVLEILKNIPGDAVVYPPRGDLQLGLRLIRELARFHAMGRGELGLLITGARRLNRQGYATLLRAAELEHTGRDILKLQESPRFKAALVRQRARVKQLRTEQQGIYEKYQKAQETYDRAKQEGAVPREVEREALEAGTLLQIADEAVRAAEERLRLFENYETQASRTRGYGGKAAKGPRFGPETPQGREAARLKEKARRTAYYREHDPAEITVMTGAYKGLTLNEIPVQWLVWVAAGASIVKKFTQRKTTRGTRVVRALEREVYTQARYAGGQLPKLIRAYLNTPEGQRRVVDFYRTHDDPEEAKAFLGAVPGLEALSARAAESKVAAARGLSTAASPKQLQFSRELLRARSRYKKVYREAYARWLAKLTADGLGTAAAHRAATSLAHKEYQKALKATNLDDYSVYYRRALREGLSPEEADKEARRLSREAPGQTPAAYQGREVRGKEIEELERESTEAVKRRQMSEVARLKRQRPQPGMPSYEDLPEWMKAEFDPQWKSRNSNWYKLAVDSPGAWKRARSLHSRITAARTQAELDDVAHEIVRLFVHTDVTGQILQDIHPFILWLENRLFERRNILAARGTRAVSLEEHGEEKEETGFGALEGEEEKGSATRREERAAQVSLEDMANFLENQGPYEEPLNPQKYPNPEEELKLGWSPEQELLNRYKQEGEETPMARRPTDEDELTYPGYGEASAAAQEEELSEEMYGRQFARRRVLPVPIFVLHPPPKDMG